jgi:hypothetical protein
MNSKQQHHSHKEIYQMLLWHFLSNMWSCSIQYNKNWRSFVSLAHIQHPIWQTTITSYIYKTKNDSQVTSETARYTYI